MDLKALLLEAKQKVPPVLQVLHCGDETMLDIGGEGPCAGMENLCGTLRVTRAADRVPAPIASGSWGGSCLPACWVPALSPGLAHSSA